MNTMSCRVSCHTAVVHTEIYEERIKQQRDVDPVLLHAGYLNGDMKVTVCKCCKTAVLAADTKCNRLPRAGACVRTRAVTQLLTTWPAETALQRDWLLARGGLGAADGGRRAQSSAKGMRRVALALHGPPSLDPAVAARPAALCSGSWLASGCKVNLGIRLQQPVANCRENRSVGSLTHVGR